MIENIITEMGKGNFSFLILIVGILQLIAMYRSKQDKQQILKFKVNDVVYLSTKIDDFWLAEDIPYRIEQIIISNKPPRYLLIRVDNVGYVYSKGDNIFFTYEECQNWSKERNE